VTPGTHVISDIESDNGIDERQEEIVHVGLEGVSIKFVWDIQTHFLLHGKHFVMYMVPSSTLRN
jgi:hypothetical protein